MSPRPAPPNSLRRYLLSERYTDTVAHGLFHFTVILLGFIIANVWASHDTELRDLRGQYSVLLPLQQELGRFQVLALHNRMQPPMPAQQPSGPENYAVSATPCQLGFRSAYTADTASWQSIRQEDRYYLLADWPFYQKLDGIYKSAESARDASSAATTREDCASMWDGLAKSLVAFNSKMNAHMADLQDQYSGPWWRWPISRNHLRILLYTVVGLIVVLALPVLLRAGEETLRRWPGARPAEGTPESPMVRDAPAGSSAPAAAEPAGRAALPGVPGAGFTAAGGATTTDSR